MKESIRLGFAVGSGAEVLIPVRHMIITGQTQMAGKTTTLEALACRALDELKITTIAFLNKRGEGAFASAHRMQPIFRERADWQFVASVLEASMREKFRFERAWIVRASKGAKTLADVQRNVRALMAKHASGLNHDVYMMLDTYLDIVVPRLAKVQFAQKMSGGVGPNVMDLSDRERFPPELQGLVMRSVLEEVYQHHADVVTIIPEAWEFCPQGRGSPVKLAAVELIRKGAALKNFVWLDSQDIGGVDKEMLRSCTVWLLGVQREANEIKRVLENIPAGVRRPKGADIAALRRGEFFACFGDQVIRTYVQPAWMSDTNAVAIARGDRLAGSIIKPPAALAIDDFMSKEAEQKLERLIESNERTNASIERLAKLMANPLMGINAAEVVPKDRKDGACGAQGLPVLTGSEDALYDRIMKRLLNDAPALLKVLVTRPEIQVDVRRTVIEVDQTSAQGMLALLIKEGFADSVITASALWKETKRRWDYRGASARVYEQCDVLVRLGFLTKEADGYQAVVTAKSDIKAVRRDA